ncbi:MAG: CocE/NonD family hydrolase [Acidobacteria bacterium]|nr:CocE/NonD family hydrolase [Acidobacteriota bacterium]
MRLFFALLACAGALLPQEPKPSTPATVREKYTKYEFEIPMRDGIKLFTAVYVPKDAAKGPYPIMLQRTPYSVGPYGVDQYRAAVGPSEHFQKEGYIVAYQDVRGRYLSEGTWAEVRPHNPSKGPRDTDESTDTYDSIDWLTKNIKNNNGKVGMWGISYPGFYVSAGMIDAHPPPRAPPPPAPATPRLLPQWRLHARRQLRLLPKLRRTQRRPRPARRLRPLPIQNPRRLRFLPPHGRPRQRQRKILQKLESLLARKHP